jgi:hypothetical protein
MGEEYVKNGDRGFGWLSWAWMQWGIPKKGIWRTQVAVGETPNKAMMRAEE